LPSEDESQVLEVNKSFYAALEALDLLKMSQVWLHEEWVKCVHPGWGLIVGWENISESWERIFQNTREIRIQLSHVTVRIEGTLAWVCCLENISNRFGEGVDTAQAFSTNLFSLRNEGWFLIHHHASLTPPSNVQRSATTIQ
jgi:SnoaL-like domain